MKYSLPLLLLLLASCHPKPDGQETKEPISYPVEDSLALVTYLPGSVRESSGLAFWNNGLWTHNDSGDEPRLYLVSMEEPKLLQHVPVRGASARDWEDMTQDSAFFYIGDFGNNSGRRTDLVIYKVQKDSLDKPAEAIRFTYPDRTDLNPAPYQHNFDCEAMISLGDSLYLFSKNHQDKRSRLYALPNKPGNHEARPMGEMDTDGVITGADMDEENGMVVLLGYRFSGNLLGESFSPFVWILYDFPGTAFFSGQARRVDFPQKVQMEGITHFQNGQFLISHEVESGGSARLYRFDALKWR